LSRTASYDVLNQDNLNMVTIGVQVWG